MKSKRQTKTDQEKSVADRLVKDSGVNPDSFELTQVERAGTRHYAIQTVYSEDADRIINTLDEVFVCERLSPKVFTIKYAQVKKPVATKPLEQGIKEKEVGYVAPF